MTSKMSEIRSQVIDEVQHACRAGRAPLLARPWSLEATVPTDREIADLARLVGSGTEVFLSSLPRIAHDQQLAAACTVRRAGLEPVLHLAARKFSSEQELEAVLGTACGDAGVRKCLVIAGDLSAPRGPFASSLDLIASAPFRASGLREVGVGGYPDGHPFVAEVEVADALKARFEAVTAAGMTPFVVTQFCFDAEKILQWLARLRRIDRAVAVRIGLAGPTSAGTLLKVALRCWVDLPVKSIAAAPQLLRAAAPDRIVADIEAGLRPHHGIGALSLHFYTFGSLTKTAEWAKGAAEETRDRPKAG